MSNNSCDVLIVGGGPAGLAAAIALRQRGAEVLVADALRPPIDKACGEGIMPDSRVELARLGVDLEPHHGAAFNGITFASEHARVSAEFPSGRGIGVRRTTLHQLLVDRASAAGVRFFWKTRVVLKPGHAATLSGQPIAYRWLVGADGNASRVRSWAGLEGGSLRSRRFGFRAHFRVSPWSNQVEVHWSDLGQAYITPTGPEELCVSVMTRDPSVRIAAILASIPILRDKLCGAEPISTDRGCVTLTRCLRRVTRRNATFGGVALLGDASGSADAITGEGLGLAFRQALLLAQSLDSGGLDLYELHHAAILALPQRMAALLLLLDRFPSLRNRTLHAFAAQPALFRELLAVHIGEQTLPHFLLHHAAAFGAGLLAGQRAQLTVQPVNLPTKGSQKCGIAKHAPF